MNGLLVVIIALVVLGAAYLVYGRYIARTWGIDVNAKTPAYEMEDSVDYVPADTQVVFGHQFASIAGAGPITGPIQASVFGWVPVLLWILIGGVFFGAVQDFAAMYTSVKNKGRSLGYIIEEYVGVTGKRLYLIFAWLFCILVIAAFADIVANTFMSTSDVAATNTANGSVATTSSLFILEAVALGMLLKYKRLNKWVNTGIAIALLVVGIAVGLNFPMLGIAASTWHLIVFAYIFIASITPVWALLQPRDYLNSYLLLFMMAAAVLGIVVARPEINLPAFTSYNVEGMGSMFPILFVTVACGAVSGFHSLVSAGTSSKQIKNEKDMLPVSFGAMLLESLLAVIALVAVASFVDGYQGAIAQGFTTPALAFSAGIANFLTEIGISYTLIFTLINLAVSAFALTSLDSVSRIGRLCFQELFLTSDVTDENIEPWRKLITNKYFATAITLVLAFALAKIGYANIWPLFGSANQLFAALALVACAIYIKKSNRKGIMLWIPMFIMLAVTLTAIVTIIKTKATALIAGTSAVLAADALQLGFGIALLIIGFIVAYNGVKRIFFDKDDKVTA